MIRRIIRQSERNERQLEIVCGVYVYVCDIASSIEMSVRDYVASLGHEISARDFLCCASTGPWQL